MSCRAGAGKTSLEAGCRQSLKSEDRLALGACVIISARHFYISNEAFRDALPKISPSGLSLHWPLLDAALYVPDLASHRSRLIFDI
jgi:hypothetical protein